MYKKILGNSTNNVFHSTFQATFLEVYRKPTSPLSVGRISELYKAVSFFSEVHVNSACLQVQRRPEFRHCLSPV